MTQESLSKQASDILLGYVILANNLLNLQTSQTALSRPSTQLLSPYTHSFALGRTDRTFLKC